MVARLRDKSLLTVILGILIFAMILVGSVAVPVVTAQTRTGESIRNDLQVVYLAAQTDGPAPSIPAPSRMRLNSLQSANINVTYNGAWPAAAMTAFDFAVTIWEGLITSGVTIEVDATWAPLGGSVLGSAGSHLLHRDFTNAPMANTWYPDALADKLAGTDQSPGQPDIDATFNSTFPDWYFGTDANPPGNKWDFVSVVLHEIGHGLGFAGSMRVGGSCGGGLGCWGYVGDPFNFPGVYDHFTENGSGTPLLNFTNFSAALATQLQGGDIFFDGTNANAANGGGPPELYAPGTWQQGSSYSHLDETVFNGTPHALMTPTIFNGEANHNPGTVTLGMFEDMGWTLDGGSPTPTPTVTPTVTPGGPTPTPSNFLPVILKDLVLSPTPFGNPVQDPGFEAGTPNAFWVETSTNFGTPLCQDGFCAGVFGSRSGSWWAWFGGWSAYEEGSVSQSVTIPNGTATLNYYLLVGVCDSASDYLEVTVDGTPVHLTTGSSGLCGVGSYSLQSVNISAFADGGTHTLAFHSETFANNGGHSNFWVDDVEITP